MRKLTRYILLATLLLLAHSAWAGPLYLVTMDTTSVQNKLGAIDLQFAQGGTSDLATVTITNFVTSGSLTGSPTTAGGYVSGSLVSPPLIMDNSGIFNDYLHPMTFGTSISFQVQFDLSLVTANDDSAFLVGLLDREGFPWSSFLSYDSNGYQGNISFNAAHEFTVTVQNNQEVTIRALDQPTESTPEPASLLLAPLGLAFLAWRKHRA